jgi:hypothetical protein
MLTAGIEAWVCRDQSRGAFGVGQPGGVPCGHFVEGRAGNLLDRRLGAFDGQIRIVGSENEGRWCLDRD